MPASYGAVPTAPAPAGADAGAVRRQAGLRVAAAALLAAAGLVALALTAARGGGGRTELNVYQDKYRDVHAGGVWMDCLKCRHASGHCHPTKSEREGRRHMEANACPPHTGMTTVLMKRNGKVETKWIDEAVLECAMKKMGESMAPPAAEGGDEEEGDEEEGDEEEAAPLCVRPSVGERAKWEASDDCTSVADWLAGMGVYGDAPAEDEDDAGDDGDAPAEEPSRRRRLLSVAPGRLQTLDGDDAGDEGEEEDAWDPAGKSPLENWNHDTLQEIYDTYYGDGGGGGGGDDDAEEPEEEGDEEGPCERVVREAREMPTMPRASDCFGPPHTLCQIDCAAECMRAPQTPNNMMLKSARMQMLFGPGDLLIGEGTAAGGGSGYETATSGNEYENPALVIPGGNRDMFGINNYMSA